MIYLRTKNVNKRTRKELRTLILVFLTTAPANYFLGLYLFTSALPFVFSSLQIPIYAALSFLVSRTLGKCPLRWRKMSIHTFVILFTHSYWILFMLSLLPKTPVPFSWITWLSAAAGILIGIRIRLSQTYRQCDCSLAAKIKTDHPLPAESGDSKFSPYPEPLITHHPDLSHTIASSFGWKALTISREGQWKMDLVCTGRSLVSLPHFSYGALHFGEGNIQNVKDYLSHLHFNAGFSGLEWRNINHLNQQAFKISSWLSLHQSMEQQMESFSGNLRSKIRRGQKADFHIRQGTSELLHDFYKVYSRHMRKLGSAALQKNFFRNLLQDYNQHDGNATIYVLYENHSQKALGAAFSLSYQGFYENGWFATFATAQKRYASYLLHYRMISHAISLGCHTYSFGRSTQNSGVHRFKQQWHTRDIPLEWDTYPRPKINLRSQNWLRKIWKHLPPPISTRLGNQIAKWIY